MEQYQLTMPQNVLCGNGTMDRIKDIVKNKFTRIALFTDQGVRKAGVLERPLKVLDKCEAELMIYDQIKQEPSYIDVQKVIDSFLQFKADLIIAIGGGSVMDTAKLASVADNENITVKKLIDNPKLACKHTKTLMIPTTAGTGAEATPNSIVSVPEQNLKIGIVSKEMIADYIILDGNVLANIPEKVAASTGLDALAHAIECYTSNKATPFSDMFALEAVRLIFNNLIPACKSKEAAAQKNAMLLAAFYAGVAITASGTTAVHALSYPLGGRYHIAHGVSNAVMLLPVMRFNKPYCTRQLSSIYDSVADGDISDCNDKAEWVLEQMQIIIQTLNIPNSLKEFGILKEDLDVLVEDAMKVRRLLDNNCKELSEKDIRNLYKQVM